MSWIRSSLVCLFLIATASTVQADLEVGVAKRSITPKKLLPVSGGVGIPKPATKVLGDLTARAMVLKNGETTFAIVQLDNLGFPSVLGNRIRAKVKGIPAENIMIGSTHTHSAPDCYGFPTPQGGHTGDLKYMDFVCERTAEAINDAISKLQPATLKINTGEAKGKIAYNYYAPMLYDPRMSVIQALDSRGNTIVTLVNYAIHPEVLGNSVGALSPDLVGPLCDKLEAGAGGMAMVMNGAQGGMMTADNRNLDRPKDSLKGYWDDSRTWEECVRIGELMATEAMRIIKNANVQKNPKLFCTSEMVRFPVDSLAMWSIVTLSPLKYPHNDDQSISVRINLVNIGDSQILTIPGEALPNIGYYLKRKMKGKNNLLFGLTNDAFGYILTKVDYNSFSRYDYVSATSLGEMTGEILIENSLKIVDNAPAPE